jgi:Contractile injection system tape measure protein
MRRAPGILIRVIFELHFRGKDRVTEIQNRISAFSASPFHALMAEGLAGMIKDRLLIFERVELDVGEVRVSRLEDDLATGIAKCLRRWAFTAKPSSSGPLPLSSRNAAGNGSDDLRPQYPGWQARRGLKPLASAAGSLNAAIATALEEPGDWPEFLAALRHNQALRRRLADEVSPTLLRRLVGALVPDRGIWIADFAEALLRLHERHPLLTVNIHVFRRGLWECILAELARPQRAHLSQRSFIICVLKRLVAEHSSAKSQMAANIVLALERHSAQAPVAELLAAVVAELKTEDAGELPDRSLALPSAAATPADETESAILRRLDDLTKFLELGALPWNLTGQDAEEEMLDLLAAAPDEVCALVRKLNETEAVRKRIAGQFSEPANRRLLIALAPAAASWMISCLHQLRRLHAQKPLFPVRNRQFAQDLWELCFEYLAQRNGKNFDPRSFLRHLLMRLAARRNKSYESLLADVLLRRDPESTARGLGNTAQAASLEPALIALLDQSVLELADFAPEVPHFLVDPDLQHYYSDLDVLAHWLRWRKLPSWSHATNPEDTGRRLGSLLHGLPRDVQAYATRTSTRGVATPNPGKTEASAITSAEQIRHWLAFGLWPQAVMAPDGAQLGAWLESQSDADWLRALEGGGAQEAIIARLSRHLSPALFERITRLLAGHTAGLLHDYLRCLDVAGRHIAPVATQLWADQLRKYTLMYLLRASTISGKHAISVSELARSTMLALSLNCRVPYERLLDAVDQESQGQEEVQRLCHTLRQELETDPRHISAAQAIMIAANGPGLAPSLVATERRGQVQDGRHLRSKEDEASGPEPIGVPAPDDIPGRIAALGQFLRTGQLPRWAEAMSRESSRGWVTPCLSGNSQLLLQMLRSVSAQPGALPRLIRHVAQDQLEQIVHAAEPEYGGLLLLYVRLGSAAPPAGGAPDLRAARQSRIGAMHWQQTLALLLDEHPSKLSPTQALHELTGRVSRSLAMAQENYVTSMLQMARRRKGETSGYTALADMLEQMLPSPSPQTATETEAIAQSAAAETACASSPPAKTGLQSQKRAADIHEAPVAEVAGAVTSGDAKAAPALVADTDEESEKTNLYETVLGLPPANDALEQLHHLLRYGQLAESAPNGDREQLMAHVREEVDRRPIEYRRYLLKAAGHELERKRMARFLPPKVLTRLWPLLVPAHHDNTSLCFELLEETLSASSSGNMGYGCHEIIVEELFLGISNSQGCRWDGAAYFRSAIKRLAEHLSLRPALLVKRMRSTLEAKPGGLRKKLQPLIDRVELETATMPPLRRARAAQSEQQTPRTQQAAKAQRHMPEGEPFYISNAGLVLLWPFLQPFFQRLGMLDKNAFRDEQAQTRAIYLLQYLTTGILEAPEHQLLLNKILAGAASEQPVECPAPITNTEEALSGQLLEGVLKNWKKLNNTSIQGLRASFLMREGKLLLKDDAWSLTVSAKGYDILLDSLPWGLSLVRLPWMKTRVHVKWR